jgi:ABC-type phosphate transport system substrate-binding protein
MKLDQRLVVCFQGALLTLAAGTVVPCAAQVAVIVGPKSTLAAMTQEQVASVFLGKTGQLPDGSVAKPADLPDSNPTRELFYGKSAGKSAAQVKAAWSRLTFSGKGTPPKELPSAAEVKAYVAGTPGGIGYIEKSAVDPSVTVVLSVD